MNSKGIALVEFHLGCIFKDHGSVLFSNQNEDARLHFKKIQSNTSFSSTVEHPRQAYGHFDNAFQKFDQVNHLKGMQLCKKYMTKLGLDIVKSNDYCSNKEIVDQVELDHIEEKEFESSFKTYEKEVGLQKSSYILRQ